MKLLDYYASHFKLHGDLKILKHPYFDSLRVPSNKPCFFDRVCKSKQTFLAMSSRSDDKFKEYPICLKCASNYFTSWNQPDMVEYHQYAYDVDLNQEIPEIKSKYQYDSLDSYYGKKINWLVTRKDGMVVGFYTKPKIWEGYWVATTRFSASHQPHIKPYSGDWKDSLEKVKNRN